MRNLLVMLIAIMFVGCTTNLAWRGVVINTSQEATTDGKIKNQPKAGDNSVAAEKQTDFDVPFSTGSGSVNNAPTGGQENKTGGNAATNTGASVSTSSNVVPEATEPVAPVETKTE